MRSRLHIVLKPFLSELANRIEIGIRNNYFRIRNRAALMLNSVRKTQLRQLASRVTSRDTSLAGLMAASLSLVDCSPVRYAAGHHQINCTAFTIINVTSPLTSQLSPLTVGSSIPCISWVRQKTLSEHSGPLISVLSRMKTIWYKTLPQDTFADAPLVRMYHRQGGYVFVLIRLFVRLSKILDELSQNFAKKVAAVSPPGE